MFFLDVDPDTTFRLMKDRANKITQEEEKDIHESVMDEYARYLAMKNQADLAYIAMMNGIELEEQKDEHNV